MYIERLYRYKRTYTYIVYIYIHIHLHIYQSCHVHNVYAVLNYIHSTMLHDNSSPPHPTSSPPSPVPHLHWKSTPRGYLAQGFDVKAGTWLGGSKNALWANQLGHEKHHHKLWDSESTIQLKQLTRQYFVHQQWISPTCNRNHLPYLHFLRSWNGLVHHLLWTNAISMFDLDSHFFPYKNSLQSIDDTKIPWQELFVFRVSSQCSRSFCPIWCTPSRTKHSACKKMVLGRLYILSF